MGLKEMGLSGEKSKKMATCMFKEKSRNDLIKLEEMEKSKEKMDNASMLGRMSKKEAKDILLFLAKKAGYERYVVTSHPFKLKSFCLMLKNSISDWAFASEYENDEPGSYSSKVLCVKSKDERDVLEAISKAAECGHETYVLQSISKARCSKYLDIADVVLMHPGQTLEEILVKMDLDVAR